MRGAACFAFPSFNEGFEYSPREAMQAGVSRVVSDLPVFRWSFGNAAIYVDPYDTDSIATGIERIAVRPGSAELSARLGARSAKVLERFRPDSVAQEWDAVFDELRRSPGG